MSDEPLVLDTPEQRALRAEGFERAKPVLREFAKRGAFRLYEMESALRDALIVDEVVIGIIAPRRGVQDLVVENGRRGDIETDMSRLLYAMEWNFMTRDFAESMQRELGIGQAPPSGNDWVARASEIAGRDLDEDAETAGAPAPEADAEAGPDAASNMEAGEPSGGGDTDGGQPPGGDGFEAHGRRGRVRRWTDPPAPEPVGEGAVIAALVGTALSPLTPVVRAFMGRKGRDRNAEASLSRQINLLDAALDRIENGEATERTLKRALDAVTAIGQRAGSSTAEEWMGERDASHALRRRQSAEAALGRASNVLSEAGLSGEALEALQKAIKEAIRKASEAASEAAARFIAALERRFGIRARGADGPG